MLHTHKVPGLNPGGNIYFPLSLCFFSFNQCFAWACTVVGQRKQEICVCIPFMYFKSNVLIPMVLQADFFPLVDYHDGQVL